MHQAYFQASGRQSRLSRGTWDEVTLVVNDLSLTSADLLIYRGSESSLQGQLLTSDSIVTKASAARHGVRPRHLQVLVCRPGARVRTILLALQHPKLCILAGQRCLRQPKPSWGWCCTFAGRSARQGADLKHAQASNLHADWFPSLEL